MSVTVVVPIYENERKAYYERLSRVFAESVRLESPGTRFEVLPLSHETKRIGAYLQYLKGGAPGPVLFCDADLLCVGTLESAFEEESFDVGFTLASPAGPIDPGVLLVNPTPAAYAFLASWADVERRFIHDTAFRVKFGGKGRPFTDAALAYLSEHPLSSVRVLAFPSQVWNASRHRDWQEANRDTRLLHYRGNLRQVTRAVRSPEHYTFLASLWHYYEACTRGTPAVEKPRLPHSRTVPGTGMVLDREMYSRYLSARRTR